MAGSSATPLSGIKAPTNKSKQKDTSSIKQKINTRQTCELVIAFSGPLGSGIKKVIEHFTKCAHKADYTVERICLSDLMITAFNELDPNTLPENLKSINCNNLSGADRYRELQNIGNYLRNEKENDILVQYAINEIIYRRAKKAQPSYDDLVSKNQIDPEKEDIATYTVEKYVPDKTIYIIDQLKNNSEAELLKDVYGDLFYLIGILCNEEERIKNLKSELISETDARDLMDRDRKQEYSYEQQLEKTLNLSDYFIKNSEFDLNDLENKLTRFLDIIHCTKVLTPTIDEHAMYIAHSAALKSACLSRQVGASILNQDNQVIATGCNDVPKFNGGLYNVDCETDLRCFNSGGKCYNDDFKKTRIKEQIKSILIKNNVVNDEAIIKEIFTKSRVKDLIEFSRSIHAEMDAITSIARSGSNSTQGCTLYTTTYPCHNCARHIVASGIHKVIYIEPYEKSLAIDLHGDSISNNSDVANKVTFTHFEGVSPNKYQDFFLSNTDRKDSSGKVKSNKNYLLKRNIHPYLDSYRTLESRVLQHLETKKKN